MRSEEGYTVIELIVSLTVLLIVSSLVFISYRGAMKWNTSWQRKLAIQNEAHLIMSRLSMDVRNGSQVVQRPTNQWSIENTYGVVNTYHLTENILLRNNHKVSSSAGASLSFNSTGTSHPGSSVPINLTLSSSKDTLRLKTSILPRSPRSWEPIASKTKR